MKALGAFLLGMAFGVAAITLADPHTAYAWYWKTFVYHADN